MGLENVKYDAFISYRHCELDSFVTENLHKKLENFKLPKAVLKKLGVKKKKIERVFRDEAELPLSDNLSDPIEAALRNSEFLIVICTPRLPLSSWCKKEIETFVSLRDRKHVLLVLAEGEPEESFPEILLYEDVIEKDLEGNEVVIRRAREPLAADCRGKNNRERLKAMDNAVIKLVAAMMELNYDDLKQRHREQQIKRRLIVMEAIIAIVALFAMVCVMFTVRIKKQNETIQDKYASSMASASKELYDSGRRLDAIYAARSVLPDDVKDGYNEDAFRALVDSMGVYVASEGYNPKNFVTIPSDILSYKVSPNGERILALGANEEIYILDVESGETICKTDSAGIYDFCFCGNDGYIYSTGLYDGKTKTVYVNVDTNEEKELFDDYSIVCGNSDGSVTCTFSKEGVKGYNPNGSLLYEINFSDYNLSPDEFCDYYDVSFSEDGRYCAFSVKESQKEFGVVICRFESETGKINLMIRDDEITDYSSVATDEWSVFVAYSAEADFNDSLKKSTFIKRYDIGSSLKPLAKVIEGDELFLIKVNDYSVCVYGNNKAMILDFDLNYVGNLSRADTILNVFSYDTGFAIVDSRKKMFILDSFYTLGADITGEMFPENGDCSIAEVIPNGDRLYLQFNDDASYVTVYEKQAGEWTSNLSNTGIEEFNRIPDDRRDFIVGLKDVDEKYVHSVIYSDDEKYVAVQMFNGAVTIYNAKTKKAIKSLYTEMSCDSFVYLEKYKSYVMFVGDYEYIFDKKFRFCSTIPYGHVWGIADDNGDLVVMDGQRNYYRIELQDYNTVIKKADEILGEHEPEKKIQDKYNITIKKRNIIHELKGILGKSIKNK